MDASGVFHLFWVEPNKDSVKIYKKHSISFRNPAPPMIKLYNSNYKDGNWSKPEEIFEAKDILFQDRSQSDLLAYNGKLYLVFYARIANKGNVLVFLMREHNGWHVKEMNKPAFWGVYVQMIHLPDSRKMLLALIAPNRNNPENRNSVFIARSNNDGKTWTKPKLIVPSGRKQAFDPQLLVLKKGVIHLLFDMATTAGGSEEIWHLISTDGGTTWKMEARIKTHEEMLGGLQAVIDDYGDIHILFRSLERRRSPLYYMYWNKHLWSKPQKLSTGSGQHTLYKDDNGNIYVFYNQINPLNYSTIAKENSPEKQTYYPPLPVYRVKILKY
jgi:hypothetical protein